MREILFRGKNTFDGHWVHGLLISIGDELSMIVSDNGLNRAYPVSSETVGQYTGLTDKNGKKVFEGDIVKLKHPQLTAEYGTVIYKYCSFCVKSRRFGLSSITSIFENREVGVIGNIHDNPELLGGDDT